ncbi:acyl carrier protein [Actinophytocola oryzae]|uniref:Acyl carrier protein n=1 Tax=Actinophytocola oryzae TaxID=502181 RepID=A0A4R7US75_9PSEU|nr:acyl carrier protein [Actinophytocola oryzae]TDV38608.1 acyl carrier protein [Actinophytocola oryzae]
MSDLSDEVRELLVTRFEVEAGDVAMDASLDDIGLDSLAQIEFGDVLGQKYAVTITDDEMVNLPTLGEVISALRAKGATAAATS